MTPLRTLWNALSSTLSILGASLDAARAVRAHHRPEDATLSRLGIRRDSFPTRL
ncbi:hypothetical protein PANO111632_11415 [Paracoccus nototheniae]|uniref:hypothetical protein n=1 Tax=Paracoccus nototheniae TaxID=2489002 RepID=UPI0013F4258E|nr:hypothetical protein [Paracoccus nototheniae]